MRSLMRALVATLAMFSFACTAQEGGAAKFEEGKHYKQVKTVAKPADPKRITVEEFFWYGCQHCFHFEPTINAWKARKPADVDFIRIPASLGRPEGIAHQKAFYTAEVLGVSEKVHTALFNGIHQKQQPLFTQDALRAFFNEQTGIMPDVFDNTFGGFTVDSRVRVADGLGKSYLIFSVPAVVVGGKYQTTAQMAGGTFTDMTKVIDHLVEKVRKERKG
jgi:protein dithiol oxidoreductase (disulfide-forming)